MGSLSQMRVPTFALWYERVCRTEVGEVRRRSAADAKRPLRLNDEMTTVRRCTPVDIEACVTIVHALPDHFTDDVPAKVADDLRTHHGWVAAGSDAILGFVVVAQRSRHAAEVLWLAVAPAAQRIGIATRLLDQALDELHADGLKIVETKTLDASVDYPPYNGTRAFWQQYGFVQVDTIDPLPGWQPGNPAAIYIAALTATTSRQRTGHSSRRTP
jgi:ribosomal protein S18 acetylase RimI-like enzyme